MKYRFLYESFKDINLNDPFFDSLKTDYTKFEGWFNGKSEKNEKAYIQTINGKIEGFLYLKIEEEPITDVEPIINYDRVVKIGTMKIDAHGTRLGERFIKKALDFAIKNNIKNIYVTVFSKHEGLIKLYEKYGFKKYGKKKTSDGCELVLLKDLSEKNSDCRKNYPIIDKNSDAYLLSIYPKYHTRLFPDSRLNTESIDIVEDVSHTNSIEKIYICRMKGVNRLKKGDNILIYRSTDIEGQAEYRSVATSVCVVDEVRSNRSFASFEDYKRYCKNYSIFTDSELKNLYDSRYEFFTIKITYNIALTKRMTRHDLINKIGLDRDAYPGFLQISNQQLEHVIRETNTNLGYVR